MSNCCEEHNEKTKVKKVLKKNHQEKPKSVFGKYLYNLGKKEIEKEVKKSHNGGCH